MVFRFWRVMDSAIVGACLSPALWSFALITAAVLLPAGSGVEAAASFAAFFYVVALLFSFCAAAWRTLRDGARTHAGPSGPGP